MPIQAGDWAQTLEMFSAFFGPEAHEKDELSDCQLTKF